MKERPILFSAPMVRAILAGTKTQTRRVVKPCKDRNFGCEFVPHEIAGEINSGNFEHAKYGAPGDLLWVRENFQPLMREDVPEAEWRSVNYKTGKGYHISYPATDGIVEFYDIGTDSAFCDRVTPSIHMPRWASRITLEITGVRVERLQDISESDIWAEGWRAIADIPDENGGRCKYRSFGQFWESINGPRSWYRNPWVWAITFVRVATK